MKKIPTLQELCMLYLIDNFEGVEDFGDLDDTIKQRLMVKLLTVKGDSITKVMKLVNCTTKELDLTGMH
jgi:hypothetical protein